MFNLEQLAEDVQQFLDLDPIHWNSEEGHFAYDGANVFYTKLSEFFVLEVGDTQLIVPRP